MGRGDHGFRGKISIVPGAIVGAVGGDVEPGIAGLLRHGGGGREITVRHMDVPAPLDAGEFGGVAAGNDLRDGELAESDGNKPR